MEKVKTFQDEATNLKEKLEAEERRTKDLQYKLGNEMVMELMECLTIRYQGSKCKRHRKMKSRRKRFWRTKSDL